MIRYADCKYSAFISYAHADDLATGGWISQFHRAFADMLAGRLARQPGGARPCHLSQENGPIAGELSQELLERIKESFAMLIVVHENYVTSEWCLKELKFFRELFGSKGFLERLYILALSKESIDKLVASPLWKELVPPDQVWLGFFDDMTRTRPVNVFMAPSVLDPRFQDKLQDLVKDAAEKIRLSINDKPAPPFREAPASPQRVGPGDTDERLKVMLGVATTGLADAVDAMIGDIGKMPDLQLSSLDPGCLLKWSAAGDLHAELADADCLVLPFDDSPPLLPLYGAGGHLALQRDEWLALPAQGERPRTLLWVDLAGARTGADKAAAAHAAFVATVRASAIDRAGLLEQLTRLATLSIAAAAPSGAPATQTVRVYIESNPLERDEWRLLGKRIEALWQTLTDQRPKPHPQLRIRGLPVDEIDPAMQRLDDADGVILLWGKKDVAALRSHINMLENIVQLDGPFPPGFVAYLMPPKAAAGPQPAQEWPVVRFNVQGRNMIEPQEETDDLRSFLSDILDRAQPAADRGN